MRKNLFLIVGVLVAIIIVGFILLKNSFFKTTQKNTLPFLSPIILYVTQPVTVVDGRLDKIEGNTLSITHRYSLSDSLLTIKPVPLRTRDLTFQFTLTANTKIFRPPTYVPYLSKQSASSVTENLSATDLRVGQFVSIITNGDLRIVSNKPLEAVSIQVNTIANTIQGTISEISGRTFIIKASSVPSFPSSFPLINTNIQKKEYFVRLTSDTEISRRKYNFGAPEQLSADQLTKDTQVIVYSIEDTGVDNQLTALRIELLDTAAQP